MVALDNSLTLREDVFDARMVSGPQFSSSIWKTSAFTLKSSKTASMTKSVFESTFSTPITPVILDLISSTCDSEKIRLSIASSRKSLIIFCPLSTHCSSLSTICTWNISCAVFCAIPLPMFPAPTMATDSIGCGMKQTNHIPSMNATANINST